MSDYPMGFHLSRSYGVLSRKPQTPYLAYGSNLSIERMRSRCPDAEAIGRAMIPGYRLLFKKSQSDFYATIEQDANCAVPVLAYLISDYDEALLDRCEGYPRHYYKRYFQLSIRTLESGRPSGKRRKCMAYVLHEDRLLGEPSIVNAYEIKTGMSRAKISHLMDSETWMNANKAIELGFADDILEDKKKKCATDDVAFSFAAKSSEMRLL